MKPIRTLSSSVELISQRTHERISPSKCLTVRREHDPTSRKPASIKLLDLFSIDMMNTKPISKAHFNADDRSPFAEHQNHRQWVAEPFPVCSLRLLMIRHWQKSKQKKVSPSTGVIEETLFTMAYLRCQSEDTCIDTSCLAQVPQGELVVLG